MCFCCGECPERSADVESEGFWNRLGCGVWRSADRPSCRAGEQQRVAVARAIVAEPSLALADEPTANLDSTTAFALLDLMEQLNRENGTTFLFSTHDLRVMKRAHRLIKLLDGEVESDERFDRP